MKASVNHLIAVLIFLSFTSATSAQTVGLLQSHEASSGGYTMFAKNGTTFLIDAGGQIVHTWANGSSTMHPGYLLENGDLLVVSRGVKRLTWDGILVWQYVNTEAHHDCAVLPNGNVLLLINGSKTNAECIAAGRDPAQLTGNLQPMVIYEVNSTGEAVWEWHVWDHLVQDFDPGMENFGVVADHPELVDINFTRSPGTDWLHGNAIDYNADLDQIMVSPRFNSEIWIIDHSTSTIEAGRHSGGNSDNGGDILYRWGNPIAYGAGVATDQKLFGSHDAQWIKTGLPGAGNIIVFNNGGIAFGRDGNYSTIDEFTPPTKGFNYHLEPGQAFGPSAPVWTYQATPRTHFYSSFISGVQRLANGNTFIDEGENGRLFEVTPSSQIVWEYQNAATKTGFVTQGDPVPAAPDLALFRAYRYAWGHHALLGRTLIPNGTVELYTAYANHTVQSTISGWVSYPGEGLFSFGDGQLIPLIIEETAPDRFVSWTVVSGAASIDDPASSHTTLITGNADATIRADFQTSLLWRRGPFGRSTP